MRMAIVFIIGLAIVGLIAILAVNSDSRRRRARESTRDHEAWSAGRTESSGIEQWMLYSMLSNQNHHHPHRHHHNDQPGDPSGGYGEAGYSGVGYDAGGVSGESGWPDGPGWGGNGGGFPADGGGLADGTGTNPDPR
ncbi:hypothetical protein ACFXO9_37940 [Nocardia tengchongensis]|uniref:hypothetical protein n=1 Tax=Nocardia tengchongensis TaxID=2055889 RepID=UPI0036974B31